MSRGRVISIVPSCDRLCPLANRYVMTSFAKKKLWVMPMGSGTGSRPARSHLARGTYLFAHRAGDLLQHEPGKAQRRVVVGHRGAERRDLLDVRHVRDVAVE